MLNLELVSRTFYNINSIDLLSVSSNGTEQIVIIVFINNKHYFRQDSASFVCKSAIAINVKELNDRDI